MEDTTVRHTCLKLETEAGIVFVEGTWYPTRFVIAVTDGLHAWVCDGTYILEMFRLLVSNLLNLSVSD